MPQRVLEGGLEIIVGGVFDVQRTKRTNTNNVRMYAKIFVNIHSQIFLQTFRFLFTKICAVSSSPLPSSLAKQPLNIKGRRQTRYPSAGVKLKRIDPSFDLLADG